MMRRLRRDLGAEGSKWVDGARRRDVVLLRVQQEMVGGRDTRFGASRRALDSGQMLEPTTFIVQEDG